MVQEECCSVLTLCVVDVRFCELCVEVVERSVSVVGGGLVILAVLSWLHEGYCTDP